MMEWKLALAQHPMYLLIKEDTHCAERTPPWGAPDIGSYIERLRQNIATLRKYPQIKIGYEWSGLELEQLAADAPDVFNEMMDLVRNGQSTFYNGTYSQPHLQTLSSESNFRQFEWGRRVYDKLCDNHQVLVYAHQESSVNEQTPQLLRAFGIRYGVLPHFISTLVMLEGGELLYHGRMGTSFIHGSEFASWRGLDSSQVDLYLEEPNHMPIQDWIEFQEMLGFLHVPPVLVEIPDLIDVDDAWIDERSGADFVLLDGALEERRKLFPPRFQVHLYTHWSYIEGIRAEELSRNNWQAEVSALRAESSNSLAYALLGRAPESLDGVWKKILTTQHHDVYCFCAPELRAKSIAWLQEAQQEANHFTDDALHAVLRQVEVPAGEQSLVVFNSVPYSQKALVNACVDIADPYIVDLTGQKLPCDYAISPDGNAQVRFLVEAPGLGYTTVQVFPNGEKPVEEILDSSCNYENPFYRVVVQPDGSFTSLVTMPSGEELLQGRFNPGNHLAGSDSTGLGSQHEGTFDILKWEKWKPSVRGPELGWKPVGMGHIRRSSLGIVITIDGTMGADIEATLMIAFYHALPRIDLDWIFTFNTASIGHFFDDETKLRVQWPLAFQGNIYHDIAFGVVETRPERPFFPASWVDISDGVKGLAYFHQGTLKHWVKDNTLINLFAWGEHTDAIGNRLDKVRWPKCFDQRLRGSHTIHTALYPHSWDWRSANVIAEARSFGMPPTAFSTQPHPGSLPAELGIMQITDPQIVATAIKTEEQKILCRVYSVKAEASLIDVKVNRCKIVRQEALDGTTIDSIHPFQIANLKLTNKDNQ